MFSNYFKTAFRFIIRNKLFSIINILGLSVGMACSVLIFLWVNYESNWEKYHLKAEQVHRFVVDAHISGKSFKAAVTPAPFAAHLRENIPEITQAISFRPMDGKTLVSTPLDDDVVEFYEDSYAFADSTYFELFTHPFIYGTPESALEHTNSIVLTRETAEKYFPGINPLGKTMEMWRGDINVKVTAVIEDLPENSHIQFDLLMPFSLLKSSSGTNVGWGHFYYNNYVLLQKDADLAIVNQKIADLIKNLELPLGDARFYLQPLLDIHLKSDFDIDINDSVSEVNRNVYYFSIIAVFVLIVACLNFMNLASARSAKRAREVGVRKVVGASKGRLIVQFLGESMIMSVLAIIIAFILVETLLPYFCTLTGRELSLYGQAGYNLIWGFMLLALFTGLFSGLYPAFLISGFKPAKVLKGGLKGKQNVALRKSLIVFQYVLAAILIFATIVVYKQLSFVSKTNLGYTRDQLIYVPINGNLRSKCVEFKKQLLTNSSIVNAGVSSDIPTNTIHLWGGIDWEGKDPDYETQMYFYTVDHDFIDLMEITLVEGRDFELNADSSNYILNEAAVKQMGIEDPLNSWFSHGDVKGRIVGVVEDFHFKSLKNKVEPMVMRIADNNLHYIIFRTSPGSTEQAINILDELWEDFEINTPMEYHFLDQEFENLYADEQRAGKVFFYFSAFAILISCLGLFGLSTFLLESRTKEIGIRKAMGAESRDITLLLTKEYFTLILISMGIGLPLAWFLMHKWLQNFVLQINIGIIYYILVFAVLIAITFVSISRQTIKAVYTNPVDALKYE